MIKNIQCCVLGVLLWIVVVVTAAAAASQNVPNARGTATAECPHGAVPLNDGSCFVTRKPSLLCLAGFAPTSDHHCSKEVREPPALFCIDGELDDGLQCRIDLEQPLVCAPGYRQEGTVCHRNVPPKRQCPKGFTESLRTGDCRRKVSYAGRPVCSAGLFLNHQETFCIKHLVQDPYCLEEYGMNVDGKCVKTIEPVMSECPKNFTSTDNDFCELSREHPIDLRCPEDMRLNETTDGELCVKEVPVAPTCPDGFEAVPMRRESLSSTSTSNKNLPGKLAKNSTSAAPSFLCQQKFQPTVTCPEGTYLVTEGSRRGDKGDTVVVECKRKVIYDKIPKCPHGYEFAPEKLKCRKITSYTADVWCPKGAGALEHNYCTTSEEVAAAKRVCPSGFRLTEGKSLALGQREASASEAAQRCTRVRFDDCSDLVNEEVCDHHLHQYLREARNHTGSFDGGIGRRLGLLHPQYPARRAIRRLADLQTEARSCKVLVTKVIKKCPIEESVPVGLVCPQHAVLDGSTCQLKGYSEPYIRCPSGGEADPLDPTRCLVEEWVAAQFFCPSGTEWSTSQCQAFEAFDSVCLCPSMSELIDESSTEEAMCVITRSPTKFPPKVYKQHPRVRCNEGVLRGRVCFESLRVSKVPECPKGSVKATKEITTSFYKKMAVEPVNPVRIVKYEETDSSLEARNPWSNIPSARMGHRAELIVPYDRHYGRGRSLEQKASVRPGEAPGLDKIGSRKRALSPKDFVKNNRKDKRRLQLSVTGRPRKLQTKPHTLRSTTDSSNASRLVPATIHQSLPHHHVPALTCLHVTEPILPPPVEIKFPVAYKCEDGSISTEPGGVCWHMKTVPMDNVCTAGSHLTEKGDSCLYTRAMDSSGPVKHLLPPVQSCPSEFFVSNGLCVGKEVVAGELSCPSGFEFNHFEGLCLQRVA